MKQKKSYSFSLSKEEKEQIEDLAISTGFKSGSAFISHLVKNYTYSRDPISEINAIKSKKEQLQQEISNLEKRERESLGILEAHKNYEKELKVQEQRAIDIIKHNITQGVDTIIITNIARHWGLRLGKDYKELIYKSMNSINQLN